MKAARINKYGEAYVIEVNDVPKPVIKDNQVLVEVHAATINPFDWKLIKGNMKDSIPLELPITVGADFSGIIRGVGKDVTDFKLGDEVYGSSLVLNGGSGAIAEYTAANADKIALKPKKLGY